MVETTGWLNHLVRAGGRYNRQRGDYYAAGITYFSVLSIFPLLMVAFSIAGYVLHSHPQLLNAAYSNIVANIPGALGHEIGDLIDRAVKSRTTVGVLGLIGGVYSGVGWMANLRAALTEQWERPVTGGSWWRTKLSDLFALLGLLLALAITVGLSAVRTDTLERDVLRAVHLDNMPGASVVLDAGSIVLSVLVSWALLTWMIARLPREPVGVAAAIRAGLLAAVAFEVFKQVAATYLSKVLSSPAGAVFGPVLGLMVFVYITYRILLFATAWAATARRGGELEGTAEGVVAPLYEPPVPAPRVVIRDRTTPAQAFGLFGAGALTATVLHRRKRRAD